MRQRPWLLEAAAGLGEWFGIFIEKLVDPRSEPRSGLSARHGVYLCFFLTVHWLHALYFLYRLVLAPFLRQFIVKISLDLGDEFSVARHRWMAGENCAGGPCVLAWDEVGAAGSGLFADGPGFLLLVRVYSGGDDFALWPDFLGLLRFFHFYRGNAVNAPCLFWLCWWFRSLN